MEWDYDKLFADGNHVGVKNPNTGKVWYNLIDYDCDDYDWDDYKNENLTSEIDNRWVVYRIIQLNNEGEITNVIFDRVKDMPKESPMPELKTGAFIELDNASVGVVIGNKIIYQHGGFDSCSVVKDLITKVWLNCNCFAGCKATNPDWEKSK